jgi:hypothetical protein
MPSAMSVRPFILAVVRRAGCAGFAPRVSGVAAALLLATSCADRPPPAPAFEEAPAPTEPPPAAAAAGVQAPDPGRAGCTRTGEGRDFAVGPGQPYAGIGDVPFESLTAGDTVRVYWREQPYREKMMISGQGSASSPIRICGVPGPEGQLPVIDGQDATTRPQLDFPFNGHQVRGLVIVGHRHADPWTVTPRYIVIEGLEVRNASPQYNFVDRSGATAAYSNIAAGIFVERADHLVIRGCTVTANNNGLFIGTGGAEVELTRNVLIEGNYVHDNGSVKDYYEHNVYNEASNVIYQYNRFGSPRADKSGVLGANIKERSAGLVVRYNWIEDGAHILDIVDTEESNQVLRPMPSFHKTYVYGNVIIRGAAPGGSMIHYGGDSGIFENYRKGTLFFYNNTVIVKNDSYRDYTRTPIFELSTNDEHLDSRNNVYFSSAEPDGTHAIGMLGDRDGVSSGVATFAGDWVKKGWTAHDLTLGAKIDLKAQVHDLDKMIRGDSPGFRNPKADEYGLVAPGSLGTPVALRPDVPVELLPSAQYVKHQRGRPRPEPLTLGAVSE